MRGVVEAAAVPAHRKLTGAELGLVQRYIAREAKTASLGRRLVLVLVAATIGLGCFVARESAGAALPIWLMGAGLLAFAYFVERRARFRLEDRVHRVRALCSSDGVGRIPRLGGRAVALPLGWDSFWTDGVEVEVDVCYLLKPKVNELAAILLLSLPPVSAELEAQFPPLAPQGNGWLALNAIALALCLLTGAALFAADSDEVLGTALHLARAKHFATVSELLRQEEVPIGVEIDIAKTYRIALDAESYLVDLREDELASFTPLTMPMTMVSADAQAQAEAQARFNEDLARLKDRVLAKPNASLLEQGEGHLPGSVEVATKTHGIVRRTAARLTFFTDATSDAPAVWSRFLIGVAGFGASLLLALRRQRVANRALQAWRKHLLDAARKSNSGHTASHGVSS